MSEPKFKTDMAIAVEIAVVINNKAIVAAFEERVSGLAMVYGSDGMLLAAQAVGSEGTPTDVAIAMSEIKTVLNTGNSTRRQREIMEVEGSQRGDYAGCIGSLLGGESRSMINRRMRKGSSSVQLPFPAALLCKMRESVSKPS